MPKSFEFPSHDVDQKTKNGQGWCMAFARAYHEGFHQYGTTLFRNRFNDYNLWRKYARGEQSIDQYKKMLTIKNDHGKLDTTWRNLDWSILKIAPKFKRVMQGKLLNEVKGITVEAVDPQTMEDKQQYRSRVMEYLISKNFYQSLAELTGQEIQNPVPEGVPMPQNADEIDIHMQLFYKDRFSMELKDMIDVTFNNNDWEQLEKEVIDDLVDTGVAGSTVYVDPNSGNIKIRRCLPERMGIWGGRYDDFRDAEAIWEYWDMSLSEFKRLTNGIYTEEQYKDMATQHQNRSYDYYLDYYDEFHRYPYDDVRITVMDLKFFSTDTWVHQKGLNQYGNPTITQKPYNWYDPNKSYEVDGDRKVLLTEVKNVYRCMWVVDTKYAFNFGLSTDIEREVHALTDARLGFNLFQLDNSPIYDIIPVLDSIQINWLQYQNHIAKSKPQGLEIEMSAFEDISLGKGGEKMTPKDIIAMYYETGNIVWRRRDWSGRDSGWKPISESKAILPEGAYEHLNLIIQLIDFLRMITGLNEVVDATSPDPKRGKAVSEMAVFASNNALEHLSFGFRSIYKNTARSIANLVPTVIQRGNISGIIKTMGAATYRFFEKNQNYTYRDFAIEIEAIPDDQQRERLQQYVNISLERQEIRTEDAMLIEKEDNMYRAAQMLVLKKNQYAQQLSAQKEEDNRLLIESQMSSSKQKAENDIKVNQGKAESEVWTEVQLSGIRMREAAFTSQLERINKKLESNQDLSKQEEQLMVELVQSREKNRTDIVTTKMLVESKNRDVAQANMKRE